jgi:hypothetical protein
MTSINTTHTTFAGSIDERGLLNSMNALGFTPEQCFSELISNSQDAGATSIVVNIRDNNVDFIDNGKGMDNSGLELMHSLHREGHADNTSHGCSGVGGKIAAKLLGNDYPVDVLSCNGTGYHKASVPWNQMLEQGRWIDMIEITPMSSLEISYFKEIMVQFMNASPTGTIISLTNNPSLMGLLTKQFSDSEYDSPMQCMSHVFGTCPIGISLKYGTNPLKTLPKINPMTTDIGFYSEKRVKCRVYKKHTGEYDVVMINPENGEEEWFKKTAQRTSKSLSKYNPDGGRSNEFATFEVHSRVPYDSEFFNMNSEYKKELSAARSIPDYEKEHFNDASSNPPTETFCEELSKPNFIRNNLNLGPINLTILKFTSGRANAKTSLRCQRVRTHVITEHQSSHRNILDEFFGVQANKTQRNNRANKGLVRNIEHIITLTSEEAWTVITEKNNSLPEYVSEEDTVEEDTVEEDTVEEDTVEEEITGPLSPVVSTPEEDPVTMPDPPTHEDTVDITDVETNITQIAVGESVSHVTSAHMANQRIPCATVIEVLHDTINALVERDESGHHYANCGKELLDMIIALKVAQIS